MRTRFFAHHLLSLMVSVSLILTPAASNAQPLGVAALTPLPAGEGPGVSATAPQRPAPTGDLALYRTHITVDSPARRARLDELGIVVLVEEDDGRRTMDEAAAVGRLSSVVVLVDDEQLETLARLRYEPRASDEFVSLVDANTTANSWLAAGLAPLVSVGRTDSATGDSRTNSPTYASRASLRAAAHALTPEQRTALADLTSLDDDADGLTNAQESWWCTDPLNADTDGDGASDGAEVAAAKDWLGNRRAGPPSTGRPFAGWPPVNFDATRPPTCRDGDADGVPDMAERWDLGLNMNAESTDRDKFDDGQELFGTTEWGRGALPRIQDDAGYIFAEMPTWVKAPGNHPFVAAFPVPEIDVVASSLKVETVTTVTTDQVISEATERSYSTAKTEGTSDSTANTRTWNTWQEESEATQTREELRVASQSRQADSVSSFFYYDPELMTESTKRFEAEKVIPEECSVYGVNGGVSYVVELGGSVSDSEFVVGVKCKIAVERKLSEQNISDQDRELLMGVLSQLSNTYDPTIIVTNTNPITITNVVNNHFDTQGMVASLDGIRFAYDQSGKLISHQLYELTKVMKSPIKIETKTKGKSEGGAQTVEHTTYEEHTNTKGEAFSDGISWGTATAVNSAHAANLWFTYNVRNTGTEYARQICDIAFNVFIGDDPNPAYTYFVDADRGGDGCFNNFMPGEQHQYSARTNTHAIPLSLEQLKTLEVGDLQQCLRLRAEGKVAAWEDGGRCPGGNLRVVVEDFTYGVDELFYQDAANAGLLIALEDGTDDGNEAIDSYLLPTWGEESVVDVLARYFPHTADENGTVIAIWTPEYRSDTPSWCADPKAVGIGGQRTLWCKHALSTADWWNVYTNGLGDGSEGFQDTPASPGAVALFRFNKDSDLDGYSDRSEARLGTDPNDPGDFPRPELLAGMHSIRSGDKVTATLSLLNTGLYDAYGVEAVLIAPDDSVSITNNTVGGSGRVRAQKQVIVGSRIALQTPLPTAWTQAGHAVPAAGGYYTGGEDRTYTFVVQCGSAGGCSVGSNQLSVGWSDSKGITGTLNFGAGYASPNFLPVGGFGLTLALHSGTVANGESFTVDTRTPRDTFQYTINREPYTEPLVIVSYNDPQGNHRFILPPAAASLTTPSDNLAPFAGQMLDDVGVEIVTTEEYTGGAASTRLLVNNPSETALTGANLFLEFINISGTVVSEVTTQVNLPPGPTTAEVAWDAAAFDPAYNADEDYIVMAFLTDYEGNILDTAGRPLSSFQDDPRPAAALDNGAQVWDFGTAQQGTLIEHPFALASVGYLDLLAYLGNAPGLSVDGPAATSISPGDVALYTVQLNTESLPVGAYEATIPVRTSDPQNPSASLTIRGTITAMPADAPGGAVLRPLDVNAAIAGDHSAGEWVEFTHSLGPDAQSLQPVKVYSQDYGTLHGVGKVATDFGAGTASAAIFGDGSDGVLNVTANPTVVNLYAPLYANVSAGATSIGVGWNPGFQQGDEILIHQTQGAGAGTWEVNTITNQPATVLNLAKPLTNSYTNGGVSNEHTQIIRVPHYTNVTVYNGGVLTAPDWDGALGGILIFRSNGMTYVESGGAINVAAKGYRGGTQIQNAQGYQGENQNGTQTRSESANGVGGGAGNFADSGGGGGYGSPGERGYLNGDYGRGQQGGYGGNVAGTPDLSVMFFGGGGGAGQNHANNFACSRGRDGGGIIAFYAKQISIGGLITANGEDTERDPNGWCVAGGGGAGGSVLVKTETASIGTNRITATGGLSGVPHGGSDAQGGVGGVGRVRVEYCETLTGTTSPSASTQKLNCHIAEQVESAPYNTTRLNLPETFSGGRTFKVQYGRRLQFPAAGTQTTTIRLPKHLYSDATLDALVNNTGVVSGAFALSLDFGNDGTPDWTRNATTTFPATLNVTGTVSALNAYLVSRTNVAWGAEVDVPVRVVSDRAADVLLTNLVLRLQVNQPTARASDVEIAADRPLDWPLQVAGNYSQGDSITFTHTLGPDAITIHPCTIYDQNGQVLKGLGKYCTDFDSGSLSYRVFGSGEDGDVTVSAGETVYVDTVRSQLQNSAAVGENTVDKIQNKVKG